MTLPWPVHALISILLWSTLAYLGTRLSHIPPFFLVGCGLTIGMLPSIRNCSDWFRDLRVLALGVAGIFGYHFFLFMAFRLAPPVEANLINYLWPVLLVLVSPLFLSGYKLRPNHVLGAVIAFTGAAIVVGGGSFHFNPAFWPGYACAFLAAIIWAVYSTLTKRLPPFPTAAVGGFCLISGLLAFLLHFFVEPAAVSLTRSDLITLLIIGLGPMGISFYSWDKAMKQGDPRIVAGLSYLTPLLSSLFLILLGGKKLTAPILVGILLIIGGAVIGSIRSRVAERAHEGALTKRKLQSSLD